MSVEFVFIQIRVLGDQFMPFCTGMNWQQEAAADQASFQLLFIYGKWQMDCSYIAFLYFSKQSPLQLTCSHTQSHTNGGGAAMQGCPSGKNLFQ